MRTELIKRANGVMLSLRTSAKEVAVEDNEEELVAAAKGGCHAAFEKLVGRYQARVFRVAQRIARSREDAEDVIQQSLQKAFVHLRRFEGRSSFSTWLTRIVLNEALMLARAGRRFRDVSIRRTWQTTARCRWILPMQGRIPSTVTFNKSGGAFCSRLSMSSRLEYGPRCRFATLTSCPYERRLESWDCRSLR